MLQTKLDCNQFIFQPSGNGIAKALLIFKMCLIKTIRKFNFVKLTEQSPEFLTNFFQELYVDQCLINVAYLTTYILLTYEIKTHLNLNQDVIEQKTVNAQD